MTRNPQRTSDILVTVSLIICLLVFSVVWFDRERLKGGYDGVSTDTVTMCDTVYKRDTVTNTKHVPKLVYKTILGDSSITDRDSVVHPYEHSAYRDTIGLDRDTAVVETHISGIKARLDSVRLTLLRNTPTITHSTVVTNQVERRRTLKDRIHIVPNVSVGYGLLNRKADVYVGIGFGLEL